MKPEINFMKEEKWFLMLLKVKNLQYRQPKV